MKIENFKLEERVLFEAGAVVQAAEAAAADQANNDAAAGETGAADGADSESAELESLAEMPVPPEMAGSDNADDSADADADGNAAADPESDAGSNAISFLDAPISEAASETSERILVVLNSSVADADSIIAGLGENVEVLKLTAGTDALDSINDYLDAHADTEYSAIHIVSHGNEGYISLNGERIEAATLNPADWKAIGEHLSDDADILIYGCDTAKSDEGKALVQSIADLTGADVAASTDSTGAHGDWDLEYRSGLIEAATLAPESYRYDLESITITVDTAFDDASKGLTFREAITQVNEGAVGNEYIINFDVQDKNEYDALLGCVYLTNDIAIEKSVIIDGGSVDYNNHTGIWIIVERGKDGDTADANDINATITISDTATLTVRNNLTISRYQGHDDDNEVSGTVKPKVNLIAEGNVVISSGATLSAFDDFEIGTLSNAGDLVLYGTNHSFSADASGSFGNVTYVSLYQSARKAMWGAVFNEMVISTPEIVEGTYGSLTLKVGELVRDSGYTRRVFYYGELIEKSTDSNSQSNITSLYKYEYNITGNITADNLIIGNGATLNVTGAVDAENTTVGTNVSLTHIAEANRHRGALKVSGDFDGGVITNYGTLTLSGANNTGSGTQLGNVTYNGADGQTIISGTYNNLTIATAGTATAAGNIAAAATTINSGVTLDANGDLAAGTLTNNGSIAVGGAFSAAGENFGNVTYDGAEAQNIFGGTYSNLILSGGDKTLSDAVTVTGELTAGVKINATGNLTLSGTVSGTGTVAATAGTITYNGTDQTVLAGTYHNLSLNGGTKTLAGAVTANGEFSASNTTITRGEAAENVSLTLSDAGNNTTPSTLISGATFNGISVTNTIADGDGYLHLNEVNNTADANSTGIKFVFDAQITVGEITYGQTLGDIVITAENNLGETILSGTVAELGWKWQLNDETVANSTVLNVTAGTAYNLVTNTNSTVGAQNVVVNKATLTITAQNLTKVYGQGDTAITEPCYTVSGLVNGDTETGIGLNVTWTRENDSENVILTGTDAEGNPIYGGYAITISGTITSGNYDLVYAEQDAVLTITPKVLTTTKSGNTGFIYTLNSREYDGTTNIYSGSNASFTHTEITDENYTIKWENAYYNTANVTTQRYTMTFEGFYVVDGDGNINNNYVFERNEDGTVKQRTYGNLLNMIVAKNIEVVADGVGTSITYGKSPDLTYTVYEYTPGEEGAAGVRGNEWTLNDLTGELGVSEYTNPGTDQSTTATITQGTLTNENNPNYIITFTGGDFTVNGRAAETKSLTVTTAEDVENDSDDKISLREAILYAAQDAAAVKNGTLAESALAVDGVYTITFGNEVTTITVTSALEIGAKAFADMALVIDGDGKVTLSGNSASRILSVAAGNEVTVNGITFTNGYLADAHGGAVYNNGKLTITDSTFTGNSTAKSAGAIKNEGEMVIINSSFSSNTTTSYGGAILNDGKLTIIGSTFTSNTASSYGSAIYNTRELTITDSTFTANTGSNKGGVLYNTGTAEISQTNFSSNSAKTHGGAIWNSGNLTVTDAVFKDNTTSTLSWQQSHGGNLYSTGGKVVFEDTLFQSTARINNRMGTLFYITGGTVDVVNSTIAGTVDNAFRGYDTNGHTVTVGSGATLTMVNTTSKTYVSSTDGRAAYQSNGKLILINSIIDVNDGSNAVNGNYTSYNSMLGNTGTLDSFDAARKTYVLKGDSEASGGGTLVGKLDGSYYYLTRDAERNRIWQQVGGDQFYAFDAADTTNYGLKYTGTDPETGSGSVITGLVYTTALNGVSRVLTLDTFNMGSHALTPVDPATVGSLTVTTAHDTSFANSLRVVLAYAETLDGEQTITFADGITFVYLHDDLNINKSVTIDGGTTPRIVDTDFPEESAKLSETMATGVVIRGYNERQDAYIRIADDATLAVENYLTISHWHGIDYDGDVKAGGNKPQVNVTGGNVTINQNAKLSVYDNFETGTLINNGSLFLSGEKNDFHAADGGDFGNVTYVALHHSAKPTLNFIEVDIADPNIVAGTYKTLSVYSADLIRYQGWSRVPWFYGSTVTNSRDGGTLIAQTTAEVTAYGNVTAEHLIIGDGVTLKIAANGDATQKGDLTVTGTTTVGSSEDYDGITDPVRGTLIVAGNITAATLTNIGGITVGGDFTATADNYGKVTYNGNADQKVSAGTYTDLVIETAGTATVAGSVTADATTVGETATFDVDGDLSAGTLTNNGTIALSGALSGTLNGTSWGNMSYYGNSAQEVFAGTYGNLTLSGEGAKTLAGAIVVNGDFTANAAFSTASDLDLHGAVSGTGTINATAGTVTYDLDSTEKVQVILAGTYYNLALSGGTKILTSATVSNTFSASNTKLQKADDAVSNATLTLKSSATTGTDTTPSSTISGVTFNGISVTDGEGDAAPLYVSALTNSVINSERIEYVMDATVAIGTIDYGTALGDVILTITSKNDPNDVTTGTVRELGWSWQIADSDGDGDTNDEIVDATTGTAYNLIAPSGALEEVTLVVNKIYEVITVDIVDDLVNDADGKTSLREAVNTTNKVDSKNIEYTIKFAETITTVNLLNDLSITSSVIMNAGNGVSISVASGNDGDPGDDNSIDAEIQIAQNVTLTVNGNLTISRFHGNDNDSELNNIASKPKVNLVGEGSVLISAGATLTAFDHVTIGTLSNKGSLLLYGADNDFKADATGSFGDVTYIGLHHDAVTGVNSPLPTLNFPAPDVVAGTYGNLTFISAELMKDGYSRTIVPYGDTRKGNFWVGEKLNQISTTSDHITSLVVDGVLNATTLVINGGVILDVNGNFDGGTLTNNGTLILSGAENAATGTLGNVIYDGTGTQNVIGGNYGKLTLENGIKVMSSTAATKVIQNFTATDTTIRSDSSSLASLTVTDAGTATSATTAVSGVIFENMAVVNTANTEKLLHVSILNNAKDEATTGINLVSTSVDDLTFTYGTELGDAIITIRNGAGDVISGNQTLEELGWELQKADAGAEGGFVTLDYGTILNVAESGTYRIKTASGYTEEVTLTVNKATVTIKADNASKTYGDADPEQFTYQAPVGLIGTDTVTVTLNRATGENAGTYAITITATMADEISGNYEIKTENGTFTINRKAITVTPDADQSVSNAGSFTYTVTDADGNPLEVTLNGALGFDNVTHKITQGTLTDANNKNYSITFTSGVAVGTEAKSLTVTTTDDIVDAYDGKISLREAIAHANADAAALDAGTITVSELADANGIYTISFADFGKDMYGAPYLRVYLNADNGALNINTNITIDGGTANRITTNSASLKPVAAALSESVARGIIISVADSTSAETRKDVEIKIADDATLTVKNYLTISHWHGMAEDKEVQTSEDIKSRVNLTGGGNVTVSENAKLSVYDSFEIGTLVNNGSLFLYGENNAFSAADGGDFGNVTYVAMHHSAKSVGGLVKVEIAAPNIVAGTYETLSVYSADLIRYQGWSRVPWYYGSTIANSQDGGTLYSQALATLTANGDVTAENLILGNGVTLNVTGAVDAENTTVGTNDTLTNIAEANRHWGALNVSGNFDGGTITNNGTLTLSGAENSGSGTLGDVIYNGTANQTIISGTYGDLTIDTAGTATAEGAVTADTTTVNADATLDANGDLSAGTLTNSGTVKVAGAFSATAENLGNVTYDGTEQTILAGTYGNLTLENGTKTLSSATVNGTFTATSTTLQKAVDAESNATLTLMSSATTGTSTEPSGTVSNTAFNGISVTNTAGDGNLYVNAKGGNSVDDASERIVLVGLTSITVGGYGTDGTLNATYGETLTLTETRKEITVNIDGENVTLYLDVTWKLSDELSGDMSMSGFVNAGTYNGVLTVDTVKAYTKEGEVYTEVTNRYAWDKSVTSNLVIGKATITVSGITANGKTYDGTTAADIVTSGADLEGKVEGDDLTITATGAFADANAGENKSVTGTLELTGADAANYTLADSTFTTTATIAAKKVDLVWSSTGVTYTYNGDVQSVTATYTDVTGATQNAGVSFGDGITFKNAGDYTATAAAAANYEFNNATQNLNIGKATISVSDITAAITEQTYDGDTAVDAATLTVAGVGTDGTLTVNFTSGAFNSANVNEVATATFSGLSLANSNYQLSADTITVGAAGKITAKEVTLAWEKADSYTYTGADQSDTVKAYYTDVNNKTQYVTVTFDKTFRNAGDYTASAEASAADSNYKYTASSLDLTIAKAKITVSGISANGKVYDGTTAAEIVTSGADLEGKVDGEELTINILTGLFADANAGADKEVTGTFELTGAAKDNYELTANTFSTTATITAKDVTLAWEKADSYTYTGKDQSDTVKAYYTDLNGEKQYVDVTFDKTFLNAGDYTASAEASAGGNYNWSASTLALSIAKAGLTVTADAVSKTYGAADPTLTYKVTGLVNGETEADVLSGALTRAAGNNVGTYAITQGTLKASDNYNLVFTGSNLTINQANLTVTADAVSKTYGEADPTLTYKVSGLVNGDTATDVLSGALTRAEGNNVGTYAISQGTLAASSNYELSFTGANLTINKATLTVTADAVSKTYGEADPTLTYKVTGLVNGDVEADVVSGILSRNAGEDVGTYAITPGNITASSNYTLAFAGANLTINKAKITISNIAAADREYNGETGAVVTFDKNGILDVDTDKVSLSVTGTFADMNAAADKTVSLVWTLTGEAAENYELSGNLTETTADITAKKITVTAADVTVTYGQNYTLTHNGALLGSDTFTGALEVKNAAYSTANKLTVGTYTIGQGNLSAGSNYEIMFVEGALNVNKADLTVSTVTAADRAYNGTTSAELTGATYTGLVEGDVITLTGNGIFDSRNAGTQNVTFSGLAISGADAANYNLITTEKTTTATISKAAISITANDASKVYNTADPALEYTVTTGELFAGDSIALSREAGDDVGTYEINGYTITDGNNGGNYDVTFTPGTFTIANKSATITVGSTTLTYNGAAQAATEYTVEGLEAGHKVSSITLTGATDAGSYEATVVSVTILDANDNDVTSQYGLTYVAGTLNINKVTITISDIVAANREYNGGTGADVTFKESGILDVDTDKVSLSVTGTFDNKNVGTGKTVSLNWALTGAAAGNYELSGNEATATATITAKEISISGITAADKTYDGNNTTTVNKSAAILTGNVTGDDLDFTVTGAFADANAGENKTVNLTVTLTGADKDNYIFAAETQKTATATISKAQITISGITAEDKTYDGNTTATLDYSNVVFDGIVGSDKLTVTATGAFESASAGTGKNVAISGLTLGGDSLANYVLAATGNQSETTAAINKAALTVTAQDASITYGEDHSSILSSSYTVTGMVNGETASVVTGAMGIENATNLSGAGKLKADANDLYKFTLGTLTAANYDITFVAQDGTDVKALTVNKLDLSATVDFATSKVYDGTTAVTVNSSSLNTVLANDTVNFNAVLVYNDANVANANKIVSQTWEITGADAANYNLAAFTETAGTITAKKVDLAWSSADTTYTYNGAAQSVTATYTDVTGATKNADVSFGDGVTFQNAGDYTVTAAAVANYEFNNATQNLTINKLALAVTGASDTVTYDGNVHTLNSVTPGDTIVSGHTVSTTATATGTDAGEYVLNIENAVVVKDANDNDVTANYEITTTNGKLTINQKMLSVADIVANITAQTYDGDTTLDSATLTIDGVTISWTGAAFNSADVTGVTTATFTGLTVNSNYALSATTATVDAAGKILAKEISLGGLTVADKVYDGTKVAEIISIGFAEGAIISGDTVTVDTTGATANFDSANAADSIKVTASGFTLSGTDAGNYKLISDSIETTAKISKATISVNDIAAAITEQTYDGKTAVQSATLTVAGVGTDGTLTVNYTSGAFNSANVKDVATATFSGLSLTNGNYQLSDTSVTVDATGKITAKDVTLGWEKADSYTYTGADQSDTVKAYYTDVTGAKKYVTVTFDNTFRNAGDYTASAEASAADGNYKYAASELDLTIAKAKITVSGITATDREYNGGTGADVTFDKSGIVAADNAKVTLTVTGAFDNKNVGTDKAVSLTWSLTGEAADNYELSGNAAATTADITAKEITVSGITASNKIYNGNTTATVNTTGATITGMISGDNLTVSTSGTFGDKNVGSGKTVTFGALTLGGTDAGNYILADASQKTATADITAKEITVSGITASNKIYDGTTSATVDTSAATFTGMITGDNLTVSTSGTFGDKNVGTGKTVTFGALTLGGTDAGNYILAATGNQSSATADITAKEITVSGITASNKVYDGTTSATVDTSAATFTGMISGDNLTVSTSGTFGDKNVGTGKTVTFGVLTLGGTDAGNYVLAATGNQSSATADITAKEITVSGITASNKIYDGTTSATVDTSVATFTGMITGDNLTVSTSGTFGDKNVGTGKTVTFGALTLGGTDAGNYILADASQKTATADITAKEITVSGITASNKIYDGNTTATVNTTGATFTGMISGDNLTVSTSGTFGDKNVGTGKTVTFGALTLGGTDAGNYVLADASQKTTTADITAKEISINGVTIADKIYDGNTTAMITGATASGVIGSDVVSVDISGASATFANANVGTGIQVNADGLALAGADSANYKLTSNAFETTGNITKATVTVTADAQSKVYGTDDPSLTYQVSGLVGSDALTGELTRDAGENVGIYAITQGTLAASSNYNLEFTGADLTITKATVTVTADAQSKVYGEADPTLTYNVTGLVGSDALTGELSRDAGENVGTYAITQGTLAASSNYNLEFTGADLTITKATVTVTADAQSKVYGEADPSLTYQVSGLVGSDALTGELSRDAGENVGTYAITQGTLAASDNYDLVFNGANLTITKATVTVTADAQSKVYGEADPSLTYQVSGLVGSDALTGELTRDAGENVGTYAITLGTLSAGDNYDMNFTGAQFTITAKTEKPGSTPGIIDPSTEISVNPSFNADNDASSPDYRVYGKPQREAARTAWLQDAMAPFTGGKFSVTAVEDGRRHGVELGFDATPISTSVQTHHEMYGIHDDEILDDHKVFDRYEHHVIEAQEPVSLDGDVEMDLTAAQDVMDALEDLLLEIPAVELTAKASQFHDDFDAALNDLLTI